MAERKPDRLVVSAVLSRRWDRARHVLVARRADGPPGLLGLWEFPGGHVEEGEQPDEAAAREVREEVGLWLDPASLRPIHVATLPWVDRDDLRCACAFYAASSTSDTFFLTAAHSQAMWCSWAMLAALKLTPAAKLLRERFRQAP